MKISRKIILAGFTCIAMTLSGCASAPDQTRRTSRTGNDGTTSASQEVVHQLRRDVEDEVTVGREIGARLVGRFGSSDAAKRQAINEYVNLVGQTLAAQSGRPEIKFHFAILDNEDINAFATPGGFVFVTWGTLRALKSESELAGVLGHEIAHINEKHMYNEIAPKKGVSTDQALMRMLSRGGSDIAGSLAKMVSSGLKMLVEDGMGKDKEYAADTAGTLYASASGYDPSGLLDFIKRIELIQKQSSAKVDKTYPPFPDRISHLENFLKENGLKSTLSPVSTDVMKTRFNKVMEQSL